MSVPWESHLYGLPESENIKINKHKKIRNWLTSEINDNYCSTGSHGYYQSSTRHREITDIFSELRANSQDLRSEISQTNEDLSSEIRDNTRLIVFKHDFFISLLNVLFTQISQKDNIIKTKPPRIPMFFFAFNNVCSSWIDYLYKHLILIIKWKGIKYHLKMT